MNASHVIPSATAMAGSIEDNKDAPTWTSIMIITGFLAAVGSLVFAGVPDSMISLLKAMAAGAMLTVISETMLPEAYAKGGSVVGVSTLLGFLIIILIKSIH
ncbi:MAG: hypothetical protein F6K10_06405 [Moorea sp. SIO2B7]|nr:hypothetical protein [Moorena sp. SIO2B7]